MSRRVAAGPLFVRKGVKLEALIHGGKQERELRAGTENVPAKVGMAEPQNWHRSGRRATSV
jgi:cysteine sulfinate desulfinase/cysteine desulfurase-like protein